MSSYELYFNLLPSDLCAASNFRHLYLFLACGEALLSVCTAGLALTLSVAMYTHQHFVERHTNNHPFVQATAFLIAGVALVVKTIILAALTSAIILNDAEIFVACAEEDLLDENKDQKISIPPPPQPVRPPPGARRWRREFASIPGPYSCDGQRRKSLYSSANRIAISLHRRQMSLTHDPTEKARKCFQRRQACLYRQRNSLAPFPIIQLLCGAISMVFWFSIDDSTSGNTGSTVRELLESQMPSLRLFNGYLVLWTICLVHSPFFLLVATWHYARVDWQIQILAVHQFLSKARRDVGEREGGDDDDGGEGNDDDGAVKQKTETTSALGICPCCHHKKTKSLQRAKDKIRNSRQLKKALSKAEKLDGRGTEVDVGKRESEMGATMVTDSNSSMSDRASHAYRRDNRIAALSALTGEAPSTKGETYGEQSRRSGGRKKRRKSSRTSFREIHRSHMPYSVPVSPESLSFIMLGSGSNTNDCLYEMEDNEVGEGGVPDIRFPTTMRRMMSGDSSCTTSSSSSSKYTESESYDSVTDRAVIQHVRPVSTVEVPILRPVLRSNAPARISATVAKVKHVSFPAQPAQDVEQTLPARKILGGIESVKLTGAVSPMTAISEESSGASSFGSVLLQTPQRAMLMSVPRSAHAEAVHFDSHRRGDPLIKACNPHSVFGA